MKHNYKTQNGSNITIEHITKVPNTSTSTSQVNWIRLTANGKELVCDGVGCEPMEGQPYDVIAFTSDAIIDGKWFRQSLKVPMDKQARVIYNEYRAIEDARMARLGAELAAERAENKRRESIKGSHWDPNMARG
jgi:hypothetical protein